MAKKLKAVLLFGPEEKRKDSNIYENSNLVGDIIKLYTKKGFLLLGGREKEVTYEDIIGLKGKIDSQTRIDINAHGNNTPNGHVISLDGSDTILTKNLFKVLSHISDGKPLYIHMWSCFSGSANELIESLPEGSVLITHSSASKVSNAPIAMYSLKESIIRLQGRDGFISPYEEFYENFAINTLQKVNFNTYLGDLQNGFRVTHEISPKLIDVIFDPAEILNYELDRFTEIVINILNEIEEISIDISSDSLFYINLIKEPPSISFSAKETEDFRFYYFLQSCTSEDVAQLEEIISTIEGLAFIKEVVNRPLDSSTAISISAGIGNERLVGMLLKLGANPNIADNVGFTSLFIALQNNHTKLIELLLTNPYIKADPNVVSNQGETLIYRAAANCDLINLKLFIKHGAEIKSINVSKDPVFIAAQNGCLDVLKELTKHQMELDNINDIGNTPLIISIYEKHDDISLYLLENGVDPNQANINGTTPLYAAVLSEAYETAKKLIFKGANVSATSNTIGYEGYTPLHSAAHACLDEFVDLLLRGGADPKVLNNGNASPLILSVLLCPNSRAMKLLESAAGQHAAFYQEDGKVGLKIENIKEEGFSLSVKEGYCYPLVTFEENNQQCLIYDY